GDGLLGRFDRGRLGGAGARALRGGAAAGPCRLARGAQREHRRDVRGALRDVRPDRRFLDLLRRLSVRHSAEVCAGRGRKRGGDPPLGGSFPGTERREVQDLAESYARTVLDEGCPSGGRIGPARWQGRRPM
ncbi:MAG: hypothetical protein AVDCRST_MAG55-2412, partial [uncultured Rubrobacteraceae bacterium]